MSTLTPNAPSAATAAMVKVTIRRRAIAPDGVGILDPGEHALPAEWAERLIAAGLASGEAVRRYVVCTTMGTAGRVLERGQVVEMAGMPGVAIERGLVRELRPGEAPPDGLPVDDNDPCWWTHGPWVRVRALRPGPIGPFRAHEAGEELRVREADAIECAAFGKLEVLDPPTAPGREFREAFDRWKAAGAVERPGYAEVARRHRRAAERAAALAAQEDVGPQVEAQVYVGRPYEVGGKTRQPGQEFKVAEALVAEAYADNKVQVGGRPTARFHAYVRRIAEYRNVVRVFPDAPAKFPIY